MRNYDWKCKTYTCALKRLKRAVVYVFTLGSLLHYRWLLLWVWTWEHIYVWTPAMMAKFASTSQILTHSWAGTCLNWRSSFLICVRDDEAPSYTFTWSHYYNFAVFIMPSLSFCIFFIHLQLQVCVVVILVLWCWWWLMFAAKREEAKRLDAELLRRLREFLDISNGSLDTCNMAILAFLYIYLSLFRSR